MVRTETELDRELENFRQEEESAQQFFFSYLSIRAAYYAVKAMNITPLFWLTTQNALLLSTFVALGRIFDQNSAHNIDRLLTTASTDLTIYSRVALANRRRNSHLTPEEIDAFVSNAFEPKAQDFRHIRKQVLAHRRVYEVSYRDVRDKVFAHNEVGSIEEANQLLARTNVEELKALLSFLSELHEALWQLLHNGRKLQFRNALEPTLAASGLN